MERNPAHNVLDLSRPGIRFRGIETVRGYARALAIAGFPGGISTRGMLVVRSDLQVLEDVGDLLPGLFCVIDCNVLAFLGATHRVASDIFARVHRGVVRNDEGFLRAVGGLYSNGL